MSRKVRKTAALCAVCDYPVLGARRRRYCNLHAPENNPAMSVFYKHSAAAYVARARRDFRRNADGSERDG